MIELFTYTVFSLVFSTSFKLSEPIDAGLNAKSFIFEIDRKENLAITFILFSKESQQNMGMNDTELLNYSKTTFLGTSKPATAYKERIILSKKSTGEVLSTKIPVPSDLEVHLITLASGEKICIGFKSIKEMQEMDREKIISEILGSLKN